MNVLLSGGPGAGQVAETTGGDTLVWRACLYERTGETGRAGGESLRVYAHREDCCEAKGRGSEDRCE
ncbi:hypothetical protein OOJ91_12465 [Micromonospora lupini]|uniref:hypothetical protein n=1 Tax=Micromonospora lupini TaxID=285679 RepID=UPI002256BA92|nr:hypothetical protein [Micromonospora lupini]MCX5066693.1 hypothetical protein [Micromonospora lupini]